MEKIRFLIIALLVLSANAFALDLETDSKINELVVYSDSEDKIGVICWEFELESKQKQEIFINFSVEHPRTMQVEGL